MHIAMGVAMGMAFGTTGCGEVSTDRPGRVGYMLTDSAGVEVITNGRVGVWGEGAPEFVEELRIGVVEGREELQLFAVRDVVLDRSGRIYVGESSDPKVKVFGADGTYEMAIGGEGEGPGEFRTLGSLRIVGDTLFAFDSRLWRLTSFSLDGRVLDSWPLQAASANVGVPVRVGGGWIATVDDFERRLRYGRGTPATDTMRVAFIPHLDSVRARLSPAVPPWEVFRLVLKYPWYTAWGIGPEGIFGGRALWAPAPSHVVGRDGLIVLSEGDAYPVRMFGTDGALRRTVARETTARPIDDALVEAYWTEVTAHYDTVPRVGEFNSDPLDMEREVLDLPRGEHLPALGRMMAGDDGSLWVERPDLVDDPVADIWSYSDVVQPTPWDVFTADGRFLGTVDVPEGTALHVVAEDWVLVTERDELDVQYVVRYRLLPRDSG